VSRILTVQPPGLAVVEREARHEHEAEGSQGGKQAASLRTKRSWIGLTNVETPGEEKLARKKFLCLRLGWVLQMLGKGRVEGKKIYPRQCKTQWRASDPEGFKVNGLLRQASSPTRPRSRKTPRKSVNHNRNTLGPQGEPGPGSRSE